MRKIRWETQRLDQHGEGMIRNLKKPSLACDDRVRPRVVPGKKNKEEERKTHASASESRERTRTRSERDEAYQKATARRR